MLGKIEKTHNNFETILFEDSYKTKAVLRQSSAVFTEFEGAFDRPGSTAIWIGEDESEAWIHLDRGKVESLIAHLQAWLATGSFEIKTGPPTRPGREPVSETVEAEGIVQKGGSSVESSKLRIFFDVDESHPAELQLMTIWSKSLEHFDVPSNYARAALLWFSEYAKSKIAARDLPGGER